MWPCLVSASGLTRPVDNSIVQCGHVNESCSLMFMFTVHILVVQQELVLSHKCDLCYGVRRKLAGLEAAADCSAQGRIQGFGMFMFIKTDRFYCPNSAEWLLVPSQYSYNASETCLLGKLTTGPRFPPPMWHRSLASRLYLRRWWVWYNCLMIIHEHHGRPARHCKNLNKMRPGWR